MIHCVMLCKINKQNKKPTRVTCLSHQTLARITQGNDIKNSLSDTKRFTHISCTLYNNCKDGDIPFYGTETATGSLIYS